MWKFTLPALLVLSLFSIAGAQMVVGERMKDFGSTFDVQTDQRKPAFNAVLVETSIPGNVLWPGDQPKWSIQLQNNTADPIKTAGKVDVIQYGTRGLPGDIWTPQVFKIGVAASVPVEIDLAANGFQNIEISPQLPPTFGGYAVVADLGAAGRRFVFSAVRTFKPNPQRIQFPSQSLDDIGLGTLKRLGVQALRVGVDWRKPDDKDYARAMADFAKKMKDYQDNNITVMLQIGASPVPMPLGRPRPHLDSHDVMLDTKADMAWLPSEDAAFQKWVTQITSDYGWPKGPVTAIALWNEPWEGISISGWGADILRFREIYTRMAEGVEQARRDANVQVLLAGCDSSSNTLDKLFPGEKTEFLKWLDVCTIHYQGMVSPAMYKPWLNRPEGRVKIWDTESWVANVDDRVAAVVAANKSAGYDRAMGVFGGNLADHTTAAVFSEGNKKTMVPNQTAWSTAASVGAAVHFIGERKFNQLLFKNGLPWVMQFDGETNADDGTIVVVGDIGEEFDKDQLLFRSIYGLKQVETRKKVAAQFAAMKPDAPAAERTALEMQLKALSHIAGASMKLPDGGGRFQLFDFYGNPVASEKGTITVPLDGRGFFLRTDGSGGSFAELSTAISAARIDGFECIEIVPHDFLAPINDKPALRVTCTNMLNRAITGNLSATIGKLQIAPIGELSFGPGETRDVMLQVTGGDADPSNTYHAALRFDAGPDGFGENEDDVHVNLIAHRTIAVDGKLDEWAGVLPQTVAGVGTAMPTMQEAAWFPFAKFDPSVKRGFSNGFLAYDENYFYFAAKVADSTPDGGTLRFETRDDDEYFYPKTAYELDPVKTIGTVPGKITLDVRKPFALQKPDSDERTFDTIESTVKGIKIALHLPTAKPKQVALYLLDNDDHLLGRRFETITVTDVATGKVLDKRELRNFGQGTYAIYNLSGEVEITLFNSNWLTATLSGIFIDDAAPSKAAFVKIDESTGGAWKATYGKLGYLIAGGIEKLPGDVKIDFPQNVQKKEHTWPDDVRRFSYRKRPILPAGSVPAFDNIQIAFNAIPLEDDPLVTPNPPGTMPKYTGYRDTDYQYALNKVSADYGGGTEIWRLEVPDQFRKHFYPRQPKAGWEGAVKDGKLVVTQDDTTRIVECALPWHEIPDVKKLLDAGKTVKFSFRVNDNAGGGCMELARGRAASRKNPFAFEPDWVEHWANEIEFAFEKPSDAKH